MGTHMRTWMWMWSTLQIRRGAGLCALKNYSNNIVRKRKFLSIWHCAASRCEYVKAGIRLPERDEGWGMMKWLFNVITYLIIRVVMRDIFMPEGFMTFNDGLPSIMNVIWAFSFIRLLLWCMAMDGWIPGMVI